METEVRTEPASDNLYSGWGCQLLFTESIEEAKSLVPALKLAAIVLDMSNDPDKVIPLLKEVALNNRRGAEVIVIISGMELSTAQQIQRNGATEILIKPFPASRLRNAVTAACSKAEAKGEVAGKCMVLLFQCPIPSMVEPKPEMVEATAVTPDPVAEPETPAESSSETPDSAETTDEKPETS